MKDMIFTPDAAELGERVYQLLPETHLRCRHAHPASAFERTIKVPEPTRSKIEHLRVQTKMRCSPGVCICVCNCVFVYVRVYMCACA